ncbi:MAG: hypothetical protein R2798_13285 [Chitinophagales bacterium]|nr:hypothetical protein [Bacteroidota bacterium]MCB9044271.1 hypothetical protein [Chitinophagales bacterium]
MKVKLIGILLLFCLVAPVTGMFFLLQYQKFQLKKEIKQHIISGIDKEDLVLLKFTREQVQSQLVWEHDKEFSYQGEMYDIVSTQTVGDTIFYWCWWDNEETQLNQKLIALLNIQLQHNQQRKSNQQQILAFFKSLFCNEIEEKITFSTAKENPFMHYCFHYQHTANSPPFPPPRLV